MMGENGFTQQRRELIGNVMAISNALNAAAAPAIADQVRDPNRQNYYVADGTGIAVSLKIGVGGERWMAIQDNFFNTVLPPNGPNVCAANANNNCNNNIMLTAASYHQGGCHVLMTDGAVRFVTDNIEAGDKNVGVNLNADSGRESPRGLWGALGSRAGAEAKSL